MTLEDQAINVLADRCRYCGVSPDEFHDKHCNVVLTQRLDDLIGNLNYSFNELSHKLEQLCDGVRGTGQLISQHVRNYDLIIRHKL